MLVMSLEEKHVPIIGRNKKFHCIDVSGIKEERLEAWLRGSFRVHKLTLILPMGDHKGFYDANFKTWHSET